jgi:hypothetical protein
MQIECPKEKINIQETLPLIIEKIFAICKTDPNFHLKDELEIVDNKKKALIQKIERQDLLIQKAQDVLKEYEKRNALLREANLKKQSELLEQLGSEL